MTVFETIEKYQVPPPSLVPTQVINKCERCSGTGYIKAYSHIEEGICFECRAQPGYGMEQYLYKKALVTAKVTHPRSESVLSGYTPILDDSDILDGAIRLSDEGFDDEILLDYAHQMSKR